MKLIYRRSFFHAYVGLQVGTAYSILLPGSFIISFISRHNFSHKLSQLK
jgi:hypothetical protein